MGAGSNTSALTIGPGGSLAPTGTGTISSNQVNAGTIPASKTIVGTNASNQIIDASAATLANNTTGSAAKWTTARNLAGNSVDGSANVNFANKFIVQGTVDAGLTNAQFLGALGTGILKNTTTTGVLSLGAAADIYGLFTGCTGSSGFFLQDGGTCAAASGSGTVTTSGSPASTQVAFFSGATAITSSANLTYAAASGFSLTQGANNVDAFFMKRNTDTSPTGNFLHFQNAAASSDLFKLDVSGNTTQAGTVTATSLIGSGSNGGYAATEGTGASVTFGASIDGFYPDSTNHCLHQNLNNVDKNCIPNTAGSGIGLTTTGTISVNSNVRTRSITFTFGAPEGSALTAPLTRYVTVPFGCTISAFNLLADAGTFTVKFWKVATGTAIPTVTNSISTSGVSLATGTALHSTTVTDFTTTTVTANDIMAANVGTVATAKMVQAQLECDQ